MRMLFDQGTPVPLRRHLTSHVVDTAFERGWSTLSNGELLDMAEQEGYELLITTDQKLRYQQPLANRQLAIVFMRDSCVRSPALQGCCRNLRYPSAPSELLTRR